MSILKITENNFESKVLKSEIPVLLDFWASWCGPCRMVSPIIEEISIELSDKVIGKVNVDEEPELASAFGIMSIPTIIVIKNGKVTAKAVGVQTKAEIISMFDK